MCKTRKNRTWVPLTNLHPSFDEIARNGVDMLALCMVCFRHVRSEEGRVMGYRYIKGKVQQYVKEELLGDDPFESLV